MNVLEMFWWGFCGSVAIEIARVVRHLQVAGRVPHVYSLWEFYVFRILLAFVAGALVIAYQVDKLLLAFNIGAATQLIVQALGQRSPER